MSFNSPEKMVVDRLVSYPDVSAVIGDRIFPVIAPDTAAVPFATWRRVAVSREMTLTGPSRMVSVTIALDLVTTGYESVRKLADSCRACLDGWGGQIGNSTYVRNVSLQNEADGFAQLAGGDLPAVYTVSQTYTILWGPE